MPARHAIARPSPEAIGGLVVCANTRPAPPVASSTRARRDLDDPAVLAPQLGAGESPVPDREPRRQRVIERDKVRRAIEPGPEGAGDLAAGGVARVEDAAYRVRALPPESRSAVVAPVEAGSPLHQLPHVVRPFGDEHLDRGRVRQPGSGLERIGQVEFRRIVGTDRGGDPALGVPGVALRAAGFREEKDAPVTGQLNGGAQPRYAAADDEEVCLDPHRMVILPSGSRGSTERLAPVTTEEILVATPRPYPIQIAAGHLARLGELLDRTGFSPRRIVVSSPTVWKLHGAQVSAALPEAPVVLVPDGERSKHLHTVERIFDALVKQGTDRGAGIVAVGGGVLGDMAGFAAATFLRGLALVQVPTTLLAQVDSAVGGKVGVNHPLGKNLIGAFHQPRQVVIDPLVLATLPRREFRAGLDQVVKYGVTSSPTLFDLVARTTRDIFRRTPDALVPIIAESCRIKGAVVAEDERESGPRRVLNFGHTAGHAIEAVTRYRRFRHGEAVGYGMLVAAEVAVGRARLDPADRDAIAGLIRRLGPLPAIADLPAHAIVAATRLDKKIVSGRLHFVLATGIGRWEIADDVTESELVDALVRVGFSSSIG